MQTNKKRILFCNEASFLNTGYSVYGREVIGRIFNTNKYEIAEFGIYASKNDQRIKDIPWKIYPNHPDLSVEQEVAEYNACATNAFGEWRFEDVCLDFQPDIVVDIRDFWMMEFEQRSPFRRMFHWAIMPTVDAYPQNEQWLETFCKADSVFAYSEFGKSVLEKETGGQINTVGVASPSAASCYKPVANKTQHRNSMGIDPDSVIIGTVMRNQRRKLYPDLFKSFRQILEKTQKTNLFLYCHTSYPDIGWDIPRLLTENGISHKVLFTYACKNCNAVYPSFFEDGLTVCPSCNHLASKPANVHSKISDNVLASIYNTFDLYVQYANSEGFGMPQVEAAACGVPVMSVDYSAMSSAVRKVAGTPIEVKALYKELETGCMRAVPDNEDFVEKAINFVTKPSSMRLIEGKKTRDAYEKNYSWDETAKKWENLFDSIEIKPRSETWESPPRITNPTSEVPAYLDNTAYIDWLFKNILGMPEEIGSYMYSRLLRDLKNNNYIEGMGGYYCNEDSWSHIRPEWKKFSKEDAYYKVVEIADKNNYWEQVRCGMIGRQKPDWMV